MAKMLAHATARSSAGLRIKGMCIISSSRGRRGGTRINNGMPKRNVQLNAQPHVNVRAFLVFLQDALAKWLPRALPMAALALVLAIGSARGQSGETFDAFLAGLWKDAAAQGISRATFDLAFAGVTPDARVLGAMQRAPEYGKPVGEIG